MILFKKVHMVDFMLCEFISIKEREVKKNFDSVTLYHINHTSEAVMQVPWTQRSAAV